MRRSIDLLSVFLLLTRATAFESFRFKTFLTDDESPEVLGGSTHPCYRKCVPGENFVCNYTFTLTQYTSMSSACRDCPEKIEDCFRKGCVVTGGNLRPVTLANHRLPGPSVQVCENDRIRVTVVNAFSSETAAIHWHGMFQIGTPFMDGVPFVTQCPIQPHNTFVYDYLASPAGTHIWHAHIGYQEADGLFSSLVVRKANDPLSRYYDYDLAEHVMIIWHMYDTSTALRLHTALHINAKVRGYLLLINGFAAKAVKKVNGTIYKTPRKIFEVESEKRYRFRSIFNSAIYCPIQISIDNHTLLMVAAETGTFEPVEVESFIINSGERYDFILNTDQPTGNYWIRYRGLGMCELAQPPVHELAILRYKNAKNIEPSAGTHYEDARRPGKLLNPVSVGAEDYSRNSIIRVVELNNTDLERRSVAGKPDYTYYFKITPNIFSSNLISGPYPQINDLTFEYPALPFLTETESITKDMFCDNSDQTSKQCTNGFCTCPMVYRVKKDSLVEMVFADRAQGYLDHPMHLHGYDFRVVTMEMLPRNATIESIKEANEAGRIRKKLVNPPIKDTLSVTGQGLTIVRFRAINPGYWFFHCHISAHSEMGMGFVVKVGEDSEMTKPSPAFPKCGSNICRSK